MGERRRAVLFIALLVAALALLTGQVRGQERRAVGTVGRSLLTLMAPVQTSMARVADAVARAWALYTEIGRLRVENARLREEVERLSQEAARLRETAAAAQRLEALLAFRAQTPYRVVAARVVGRDPARWFATIVVDRGSRDGVAHNAPVVSGQGAVGRVIETTPFTARVLLLTDPRSAVGVVLQESRQVAVVEGTGEQVLYLKYLSRARPVRVGERVITSGQGGVFPKGLLVGQVEAVRDIPGGAFREGRVRAAVDLSRVEEVLILLPEPAPAPAR
jgi:rod shape-determining protein MreC